MKKFTLKARVGQLHPIALFSAWTLISLGCAPAGQSPSLVPGSPVASESPDRMTGQILSREVGAFGNVTLPKTASRGNPIEVEAVLLGVDSCDATGEISIAVNEANREIMLSGRINRQIDRPCAQLSQLIRTRASFVVTNSGTYKVRARVNPVPDAGPFEHLIPPLNKAQVESGQGPYDVTLELVVQ